MKKYFWPKLIQNDHPLTKTKVLFSDVVEFILKKINKGLQDQTNPK